MTTLENLLECLSRVATREEERALAEFEATHARKYNGESDSDWDDLDKDYTGVEEAMNIARAIHAIRAQCKFLAA